MIANPKQWLHALIEHLSDEDAGDLSASLAAALESAPPREEDLLPSAPILPDDETADEMIATVRHWRRASGNA